MEKVMKTIMKNIWIIAALALLASCNDITGNTNETTASLNSVTRGLVSPVSLAKAYSLYTAHYGMANVERQVNIKVKNLAFEKKVTVHHQLLDGSWADYPATFMQNAEEGWEIWTANLGWNIYYMGPYTLGEKFCLKYEVAGQTYWDNNDGANYTLSQHGGYLLGSGFPLSARYASAYQVGVSSTQAYITGVIDVKNLAPNKKLKVLYTTDNWATNGTMDAAFNSQYYPSYGSPIASPNAYGVEMWTFNGYINNTTKVEYVLSYEVNGKIYWDNNFGKNYSVNVYKY